jgi:hypothetical protein
MTIDLIHYYDLDNYYLGRLDSYRVLYSNGLLTGVNDVILTPELIKLAFNEAHENKNENVYNANKWFQYGEKRFIYSPFLEYIFSN